VARSRAAVLVSVSFLADFANFAKVQSFERRIKNKSKFRALHSSIQGQALTGFDKIISTLSFS
jgi:hypothetical protein